MRDKINHILPTGVIDADSDQVINSVNDDFLSTFSCTKDEIINKPFDELISKLDRKAHSSYMKKILQHESGFLDLNIIDLQLNNVHYMTRVRANKNADQTWTFIVEKIDTDKDFTWHLQHKDSVWQTIIRNTTDGIAILERDFTLSECNHSFLSILNKIMKPTTPFDEDHLIGYNLFDLLVGTDLVEAQSIAKEASKRNSFKKGYRFDKYWIDVEVNPIIMPIKGLRGYTFILRDQTEHKELEQQRALALQNSKMVSLGQMAGGVAHEINNPLASVIMSTEQLKDALSGPETNREKALKYLEKIERNSMRVAKVVKSLRTISESKAGEGIESITVSDLITEILDTCNERLSENGIKVEFTTPSSRVCVLAHKVELSQVLLNIIYNAVDAVASLPDKWIKISTEALNENETIITICDSGKGIDEKIRDKIFDPFFTTKPIGSGMGLGLSVSKSLITKNNGEIFLDSKNPNTCFVVKLNSEI